MSEPIPQLPPIPSTEEGPETTPSVDPPSGDPAEASSSEVRLRRVRPWVVGALVGALLLAVVGIVAWWKMPPELPAELFESEEVPAASMTTDMEQLAFLRKRDQRKAEPPAGENLLPEPLPQLGPRVDASWVELLAGRWTLDLGRRARTVTFSDVAAGSGALDGARVQLFGVTGRGVGKYYTVIGGVAGGSRLVFFDRNGGLVGALGDLQVEDRDLISFLLGDGPARRYGRKAPSSEDRRRDFVEPNTEEPGAEPVQITVERRPVEEQWRRIEGLRDAGRLDSLEIALDRLAASHPDHRQARRWRRNLPKWKARQERTLRERLGRYLVRLQGAVEDKNVEGALELWTPGARSSTGVFLEGFLGRHEQTRLRYQLQRAEVEDGTLLFDATLTFEGRSGRRRSLEPQPWRGRLQGEVFLDPLSGG